MKTLIAVLVFLSAAFIMVDICRAQEDAILLKDGTTLIGKVVGSSEESVRLQYQTDQGETVATFRASELDPYSFYNIRSQAVANDAKAHLDLARFALDHDMLIQAYMHAERAWALDPAMKENFDREERGKILEGAAARILGYAEQAIEKKDWQEAENHLSTVLTFFHETTAAEKAKALIVKVGNAIAKQEVERNAKWMAEGTVEVVDGKPVTSVFLKDGKELRGIVLETTADSITFQRPAGGGRMTVTLQADRLDPISFFRLRASDIGDDAAAHLDLARFCVEQGLHTRAYFEYEKAKSLGPEFVAEFEKESLPALREEIANNLLASAKKDESKGRFLEAERDVAFLLTRFPATKAAAEARELLAKIQAGFSQRAAAETSQLVAQAEEAQKEAQAQSLKVLEPVLKEMERAREVRHKALQDNNQTRATNDLDSAGGRFEKAMKDLDSLGNKVVEDQKMAALVERAYQEALQEAVGCYIDAGNILIFRQAFTTAMKFADKALAVDPENATAQAFKARVQVASAAASDDD